MHRIAELLKDHPSVGIATSVTGALQAFMQTSTPFLQYLALLLGVGIGMVTLVIKTIELRNKKAR